MVSFVAPSGTGKTTLLEGVIAGLVARGHQVGAVKHDAHRIELDTEGKDSWRLRASGAESTLLMGRDQFAFFGNEANVPSLPQVASLLFPTMDLVLVEGFRSANLPTVMVARADHVDDRWQEPDPALVLITVGPQEVERVIELLVAHYLTA